MNNVVLIGRLTRDPELSYTPNTQTAACRLTLAVDRPKKQGEDAGADFIRITVWGKQAETCDRYLAKGRQVAVMGRIHTGSYKNRAGETVYTTEVVAERVEFIGSASENSRSDGRNQQNGRTAQPYNSTPQNANFGGFSSMDDDVPWA